MNNQRLIPLSFPTTLPLSSATLLPSKHHIVQRTLNRLTRPILLSLALDWLSDVNQNITAPFLLESSEEESNDQFPPASSLDQLREIYTALGERGGTKRDVIDRILEGDWRHGISLYAIAMADMQFLYTHPSSQKWLAWKIIPLHSSSSSVKPTEKSIPRFHPSTFLRNMHQECLPDVKVHYNIDRHATLPLMILRVWILESPYNTSLTLTHTAGNFLNTSRIFYIAFPDFSPFVFVSSTNTISNSTRSSSIIKAGDSKSLRTLILEAIPKAYSKPQERYKLQNTNLSARNLAALVERRGNGRTNAAGGGWNSYAETRGNEAAKDNPLNINLPTSPDRVEDPYSGKIHRNKTDMVDSRKTNSKRKRDFDDNGVNEMGNILAKSRFEGSALPNDGKGIETFFVRIEDPFPNISKSISKMDGVDRNIAPKSFVRTRGMRSRGDDGLQLQRQSQTAGSMRAETSGSWCPEISILFTGSHIFAGIRELVELGIIDGLRMPGWMTGEKGISEGVVRDGRILNLTRSETPSSEL